MRTVLYANREVSDYLRENYVLLWSSERPVPRVTIDFGDGRVIERTITGNAVHYVLDQQGRPLDAIPGLYGPGAFLRALKASHDLSVDQVRTFHSECAETLDRTRQILARSMPMREIARRDPRAGAAINRTSSKREIQRGVVETVTRDVEETEEEYWRRAAFTHADDARLDPRSLLLMARELPGAEMDASAIGRVRAAANPFAAERAVARAMSKMGGGEGRLLALLSPPERSLAQLVGTFEETLAMDTARNEYEFRLQIHRWFADGEVGDDLGKLNERVYREIFLTPRSDPWLGLGAQENFTGIAGGGRR